MTDPSAGDPRHSAAQSSLSLHIQPAQQGSYFTIPFEMLADVQTLRVKYTYARRDQTEIETPAGLFTARPEINVVDLGLLDPRGRQVGASGSDKTEFTLSETCATPGYNPCPLIPGEWQIIVGAYKIAPGGCDVFYEIEQIHKSGRWLTGDLHVHTLASDGLLTVSDLAQRARSHGLDFLAITDHNQPVSAQALPRVPGLTLIPAVEWTHYQGHANFLGLDQPYDQPFFTNTPQQAQALFASARQRGALITLNHPFEPGMGFEFDWQTLPFDCLEVWNGPMRASNLHALAFWQTLLQQGLKIPIVGGSDYHRDTPFIFPGGPSTCVYALSPGPIDILAALRKGHAYLIFAPDGPSLELTAGQPGAAILGDSLPWSQGQELRIHLQGLLPGDLVRVVTGAGSDLILQAPHPGDFNAAYPVSAPGFARLEVLREFIPGVPPLPALLSNPIYFDAS